MRKGKNRYIVEVNEWGCGLMIKDTQTGNEIDAPEDEVITLCIKEMNSLAKELDTVRSVAQDNQDELKATRIENARLKADIEVYKEGVFKSDNLFKSVGIHVKDEEWVADGIAQLIDKVHATQEKVKRLTKATDAMHDVITIYSGWIRLPGDDPLRDAFNQVIDAMREADKS